MHSCVTQTDPAVAQSATAAGSWTPAQRSAVIAVVVYLFAISVAVNAVGQILLRRRRRQAAGSVTP